MQDSVKKPVLHPKKYVRLGRRTVPTGLRSVQSCCAGKRAWTMGALDENFGGFSLENLTGAFPESFPNQSHPFVTTSQSCFYGGSFNGRIIA